MKQRLPKNSIENFALISSQKQGNFNIFLQILILRLGVCNKYNRQITLSTTQKKKVQHQQTTNKNDKVFEIGFSS